MFLYKINLNCSANFINLEIDKKTTILKDFNGRVYDIYIKKIIFGLISKAFNSYAVDSFPEKDFLEICNNFINKIENWFIDNCNGQYTKEKSNIQSKIKDSKKKQDEQYTNSLEKYLKFIENQPCLKELKFAIDDIKSLENKYKKINFQTISLSNLANDFEILKNKFNNIVDNVTRVVEESLIKTQLKKNILKMQQECQKKNQDINLVNNYQKLINKINNIKVNEYNIYDFNAYQIIEECNTLLHRDKISIKSIYKYGVSIICIALIFDIFDK